MNTETITASQPGQPLRGCYSPEWYRGAQAVQIVPVDA